MLCPQCRAQHCGRDILSRHCRGGFQIRPMVTRVSCPHVFWRLPAKPGGTHNPVVGGCINILSLVFFSCLKALIISCFLKVGMGPFFNAHNWVVGATLGCGAKKQKANAQGMVLVERSKTILSSIRKTKKRLLYAQIKQSLKFGWPV